MCGATDFIMHCGWMFFTFVFGIQAVKITFQTTDVLAVVGDKARLSCRVERSRENRFSNCSWVGPEQGVWWVGGSHDRG